MRVVIDTNVLVSALLSPTGAPAKVLQLWEADAFELVVSEEILSEYERVLTYPRIAARLKLTSRSAEELVGTIQQFAIVVEPDKLIRVVRDDPDDDKLIACALAGSAEFLVSGDEHLLSLGEFQGIQVLPPTAFLMLLKGSGD